MQMPRSPAARTVRRSASTPRRCPSPRGRPRAAAQRPLPSMMMATCRGTSKSSIGAFGSGSVFDIPSRRVAQTVMISFSLAASSLSTSAIVSSVAFCTSLGHALVVVLADLVILLELLEHVQAVAAHMADRDLGGFGIFVRDLDQFLAALLVELRNAQPQITCPSVDGVRPRLAAMIAFSTACTIERSQTCTLQHARLRHADGRELVERHVACRRRRPGPGRAGSATRGRCAARRAPA